MRKLLILAVMFCPAAFGYASFSGFCEQGGVKVTVQGINSTSTFMQSYPNLAQSAAGPHVTVYLPGTTTKATPIFSDNAGTVLANPFPCSATGYFTFYGPFNAVDLLFSGTGITPFTRAGIAGQPPGVIPDGAVCDGSHDDTTAFNTTLATGVSILVPQSTTYCKISGPLNITTSGQSVYGFGHLSKILQTGTNANSTVFYVNGAGANEFHDLYIVPGSTTSALADGWAIRVNNSNGVSISRVEVSGHRRGAFELTGGSSYNLIDHNYIHDSVVVDNPITPDSSATTGNDIHIYGSGSWNMISNNMIHHGAGVGVAFQTSGGTTVNTHNTGANNTIDGEPQYGMMLYLTADIDTLQYNAFLGNNVSNISGNIPDGSAQHSFGTGIYAQTAERTLIADNTIYNVNIFQPTVLLLAPGCVGVSGTTDIKVTGNKCFQAGSYMYSMTHSNANVTTGSAQFVNNAGDSSLATTADGLYMYDMPDLIVTDNSFTRSVVSGLGIEDLQVTNLTQAHNHLFSHNYISGFQSGIQQTVVSGSIQKTTINLNNIYGNTSYAILANSLNSTITHNYASQGTGGVGMGFGSAVTVGELSYNTVCGGATGLVINAPSVPFLMENNDTYCNGAGPGTPYNTSEPWPVLSIVPTVSAALTPTTGRGTFFSINAVTMTTGSPPVVSALAITNFLGAPQGWGPVCFYSSVPAGTVSTSGTAVTWTGGTKFTTGSSWNGLTITIGPAGGLVAYTVSSVTDDQHIVLTATAGVQASTSYSMQFIISNAGGTITNNNNSTLTMLANHIACYVRHTSSWFQISDSVNR